MTTKKETADEPIAKVVTSKEAPHYKKIVLQSLGVVIGVGIIAGFLVVLFHHSPQSSPSNDPNQQIVVKNLTTALNSQNDTEIINESSQLISGAKSNDYKINKSQLALYYLYLASSLTNKMQYTQAIADYQEAIKLDSSDTEGALQGEVSAAYRNGERQQVIPLLEQLVTISSAKGNDPIAGSPQQYEAEISAIQNNQPVDL